MGFYLFLSFDEINFMYILDIRHIFITTIYNKSTFYKTFYNNVSHSEVCYPSW